MQEQQNSMDTTAVSTLINRRGLLMALKSSGTGCLAFTLLQKTSRRLPMSMLPSRTHSMLLWPKAPSLCFLTTVCSHLRAVLQPQQWLCHLALRLLPTGRWGMREAQQSKSSWDSLGDCVWWLSAFWCSFLGVSYLKSHLRFPSGFGSQLKWSKTDPGRENPAERQLGSNIRALPMAFPFSSTDMS